jgi:hypothetical protein
MTSQMLDEAVRKRISVSASSHLNDLLASLVLRQGQRVASASQRYAVNEALVRLLPEKERADLVGAHQAPDREELIRRFTEASSAAHQNLTRGASGAASRNTDMLSGLQLQVLTPPYASTWSPQASTTGDAEGSSHADKYGTFGFTLGTAHGSAAVGAGVWAQFRPDGPAPFRLISTRPYVRFADEWDSNTLGQPYGAHNDGGFGMTVYSWNLEGQDEQLEAPFPWTYYNWSKDTGWFSDDHDTNWPNADEGLSYAISGNAPPPFVAWTDRIYWIGIFCFGECDAGGGIFGHGITASWMRASADFIVIQEI